MRMAVTHCGLMAPCGDLELDQHLLQAINWINVDLSSVESRDRYQNLLENYLPKISFKSPIG